MFDIVSVIETMLFESLSFRHTFHFADIPHRWLPLISLYDPDLPLFAIYYFHVLRNNLAPGVRPLVTDRAFGHVEHLKLNDEGGIDVGIVTNKDLSSAANRVFLEPVEEEIRERFGINNPVTLADVSGAFLAPLDSANALLSELWHRVIANAYGNLLPFGRMWDGVLGLARYAASFNPPSGRKSEVIMTHYFSTRFGVPISAAAGIPQVDFYLLPTISELMDATNPLTDFPRFRELLRVAELLAQHHGAGVAVGRSTLTFFRNPSGGTLNTAKLFTIIRGPDIPVQLRRAFVECFNAFDKGPPRTVLFLLMLNDMRHGFHPGTLSAMDCAAIYHGMKGSYQSPKVIQIYAQQCFGNTEAIPVDTWIATFLKWPLKVYPTARTTKPLEQIFARARLLGKVERLLWYAGQARKVHSTACNDAIWCVKYGSDRKPQRPRGGNPLACNICLEAIRNNCPAFAEIRTNTVGFNNRNPLSHFQMITSAGDNVSPNQSFLSCEGTSIYERVFDTFSPADDPSGFALFPAARHDGSELTVEEFLDIY
jgi:hypothetical protein